MVRKRQRKDENEEIRRKIRKLQESLDKPRRRRVRVMYSTSEDENEFSSVTSNERDSTPPSPIISSQSKSPTPTPQTLTSVAMIHDPPPDPAQPSTSFNCFRSEPVQLPSDSQEVSADVELDDVILNLLGDAPIAINLLGKSIHKEIASRWKEILQKGLSKENREKMGEEYLAPANCDLLLAPTLNPEAKAALTDFIVKRDYSLLQKQQQLGTALSALARATELIIQKESADKVLKPLSDACRLLCDAHHQDTKTRRNFVLSAVKPELKDTLINTCRDNLLFGENLSEQIRTAKTIQKSGEGLKNPKPMDKNKFIKHKTNAPQNLNFRSFYRKRPPGKEGRPQPQRWQRGRVHNQERERDLSPSAPPPRRRSPPPPPPSRRGRKY